MPKKISDLISSESVPNTGSFPFSNPVSGKDERITAENLRKDVDVTNIDNVATLKTFDGKRDNQAVILLGYNTKGDGGGGLLYWDSASTETDNGVTVFQVTGVDTGRWKRPFTDTLYIEQGGGIADSNAQNAPVIENMFEFVDVVKLRGEIYGFSEDINIPTNKHIIGSASPFRSRLFWNSSENPLVAGITSNLAGENGFVHRASLQNVRIDMNGKTNGALLKGWNENASVKNTEISRFTGFGLRLESVTSPSTNITQHTKFSEIRLVPDDSGADDGLVLKDVRRCTFENLTVDQTSQAVDPCVRGIRMLSGVDQNVFINGHLEDCGTPIEVGEEGSCKGNVFIGYDWQNPHAGPVTRTFNGQTGAFGCIVHSGSFSYSFISLRNAANANMDYVLSDAEKGQLITSGEFFQKIESAVDGLFQVNGITRANSQGIVSASTDELNSTAFSSYRAQPSDGNIEIGGLKGGSIGQIINIVKTTSANDVQITHNKSGVPQGIITKSGNDIILTGFGGVTLLCNGSLWFEI